jgi:DNA mismatch repair protein MutL
VERPASVVKELVENAIDAGARRISVSLGSGGRDRVEVADDGCGMDAEDVAMALRRHATSKIAAASDLEAIATLGFRGEALPSIAAVSRLSLETAAEDGTGTRIDVDFGTVTATRPVARARGTRVLVSDLFLRLPARRKFLRTEATELRHVVTTLTAIAFARPEIAFALEHNRRITLDLPPAPGFGRRLPDLVGAQRARQAVPVSHSPGSITVSGFLLPARGPREIVLVVNGRAVRDRLLVTTVARALRGPGGVPEADAFIAIDLPGDALDVNVHPAKAEVRFAEPGRVIAAVTAAVVSARTAIHGPAPIRRIVTVATPGDVAGAPTWRAAERYERDHPPLDRLMVREAESAATPGAEPPSPDSEPMQGRYVGQYRNTYLVLEDAEGLLLVDQHAAHERVLFERLLARPGDAPSQRLLVPEVVELSPALAVLAGEVGEELRRLGLDVEVVTGNTARVLSVPVALPGGRAGALVADLLTDLSSGAAPGPTVRDRTAASLSCRAAIKKNRPLSPAEAGHLLRDLAACRERHRCPHGRPIVVRLAHSEIERRIGRR